MTPVISLERALAEGCSSAEILSIARWHEAAAASPLAQRKGKSSKRFATMPSEDDARHRSVAQLLRNLAADLAAREAA